MPSSPEGGSDIDADADAEDADAFEPVTRLSDVWIVGDQRIVCGSSLEAASDEALMAGELADMIVADGPYNVKVSSISGMPKVKYAEFQFGSGEMSSAGFVDFQRAVFNHLVRFSKYGSIH